MWDQPGFSKIKPERNKIPQIGTQRIIQFSSLRFSSSRNPSTSPRPIFVYALRAAMPHVGLFVSSFCSSYKAAPRIAEGDGDFLFSLLFSWFEYASTTCFWYSCGPDPVSVLDSILFFDGNFCSGPYQPRGLGWYLLRCFILRNW